MPNQTLCHEVVWRDNSCMHSNNLGNAGRSVSMLLPPQLLYAGERAPIAYWIIRGLAPVNLHIGEKRETLPVLGFEK